MTLASALKELAPAIRTMRSNGYTHDETAAELKKELGVLGLTVSGRTLARLLPTNPRARKPRKGS